MEANIELTSYYEGHRVKLKKSMWIQFGDVINMKFWEQESLEDSNKRGSNSKEKAADTNIIAIIL